MEETNLVCGQLKTEPAIYACLGHKNMYIYKHGFNLKS